MDADIEHLAAALDALHDVTDTDRLRQLIAVYDRFTARVCTAIESVDRSGETSVDGAVNTVSWLRTHTGRTHRDAATLIKRATTLRACPELGAAWTGGHLTSGQVEVIVANVNDRTAPILTDHGPDLVPSLVGLSTRDTEIAMRHWAAHADALTTGPAPPSNERTLHLSAGFDGYGELSGRLDPASYQIVNTALDAATTPDLDGEPVRSHSQRRADALVTIAHHYLDHTDTTPTTRRRPHVHVVVTLADLQRDTGHTLDGDPVDTATVESLLCDAGLHRYITDGASVTLDAGRTTRTVNPHLFTAVALRDQGCRFPHCDQPVSRCEAHHAIAWHHGGNTTPDNLVLLCWRHHHDFAHHPHWHLKLLPDATVEVTTPQGRVLTSRPPPPPPEPAGYRRRSASPRGSTSLAG
jgi:hypothetical protein